jgi:hypothetical protein
MTFFNVRLGWWLPNPGPAGERNWHRPGPFFALQPLIFEAMGNTTDDRAWVNVSDGGHFENLGLYEMVLRRSHTIVVVDGSADPKFRLDDLANASRKIFVDFGIPIDFSSIKVGRDQDCLHCAVGIIRYSCVDGSHTPDGTVVYIKTSLNHNEPIDVQNYARLHPEFPHESTADQFFSEAQLESYRRLGAHVVSEILDPEATRRPAPVTLEQFVSAAVAYAKPDNPASKVFRFEIATSN